MKIVNIYGGFGNALFQIAYALHLKEAGHNVKLDTLGLDSVYRDKIFYFLNACEISIEECSYQERLRSAYIFSKKRPKKKELSILAHFFSQKIYIEKNWGEIPASQFSYYHGYYQNHDLTRKYSPIFTRGIEKIAKQNNFDEIVQDGLFVHIRGGDYATTHALKVHGMLDKNYYDNAIKTFPNINTVHVFTNDNKYAKDTLLGYNLQFITSEEFIYPDIRDMYLMSRYRNGIIANSTFSYWSAYLGDVENKKIVCPVKWFADEKLQNNSHKIKPSFWVQI